MWFSLKINLNGCILPSVPQPHPSVSQSKGRKIYCTCMFKYYAKRKKKSECPYHKTMPRQGIVDFVGSFHKHMCIDTVSEIDLHSTELVLQPGSNIHKANVRISKQIVNKLNQQIQEYACVQIEYVFFV